MDTPNDHDGTPVVPLELTPHFDVISIDDAIERISYGWFQVRVLFAVGLCFASDAVEILLLSILSILLRYYWKLSSYEGAFLTSVVFFGQFLGTLILGRLGDKRGRRPIFLVTALIIAIFGFATSLCQTFIALLLVRMMVGFGVGGLLVPFDILAEVLPIAQRGRILIFIEYFWTLGTLIVPLFATLTLGNDQIDLDARPNGWRYFVALCALPSFISMIVGYWLVPESPRWLVTVGKDKEALVILRQAAKLNQIDPNAVLPESIRLKPEEPEAATLMDLFTPEWRWITINLWITWAGFAFLYYGTILSTSLIFSSQSSNASSDLDLDYRATFLFPGVAEVLGTSLAIHTIDKIGRVKLQAISYSLGGLSLLILMIVASKTNNDESSSRLALIAFTMLARMFHMSGNITTWVATSEILTTDIRTTGHSAANACARLGAFCAPFLVQSSTSPLAIGGTLWLVSIVTTIAATRLPETKGKTMGLHRNHMDTAVNQGNSVSHQLPTVT